MLLWMHFDHGKNNIQIFNFGRGVSRVTMGSEDTGSDFCGPYLLKKG